MYRLTYDESLKKFGDKLWCDIRVLEPPQPEEEDIIARLQREISVYPEEQPKSSIADSFSQQPYYQPHYQEQNPYLGYQQPVVV
jgi:hypothetical protein